MRSGKLAGPVDIRGGATPGVVARLPLGAGNWTVFAKGVVRNTTPDAAAHRVLCRLTLGGSSDRVHASPVRRSRADSRQSFLLTHAAHFDAASRATLACVAPGSSTGDVVVEDIRMVAFRTAGLGIQRELGTEIFYGNADAMSQVRLLKGNDALVPFDIEGRTVATLTLPAGHWAVTAKATVLRPSDAEGTLRCFLVTDDGTASVANVTATDSPGDRIPIALQLLHSADALSQARLRCQDLSDGGTTGIRDIRLVAYRARATEDRELDPGAMFGPTPGSIRPVAYGAEETESRYVPDDVRYRTINRLSLPAGSWVAMAMGVMIHADDGRADVDCRLGRGSYDGVAFRVGGAAAVGNEQPFALVWTGSFGERRTVRFECRSSDGDTRLIYLVFLVYKVGTLSSHSLR